MRLPAPGSATTLVRDPGTNHETRAGCESVSQGRTAAATVVVPAVARPDARIPSGTSLRRDPSLRSCPSPTATRLTGSTKLTVTALPRRGLRRVERMCAAGVTTVIVRFSWPPTSQPIQLGRRISTVTVKRSPGLSRTRGHTVPPRSVTGSSFPSGPLTDRCSTWPEKPGSEMPARPLGDAATPPLGQASNAAPAATATTRPKQRAVRNHLRNTTISVCPTLRTRWQVPTAAEGSRASSQAARSRSFCAASESRASAVTPTGPRTWCRSSTRTKTARSSRSRLRAARPRCCGKIRGSV